MKKYPAIIGSITLSVFLFLLSVSVVNAAVTSGPVGTNGIRAYAGPGRGEVTLEWSRVSTSGENYSVYYGTVSKVDQFIAPYVGYIATYTVMNLTPGQRYYFRLHRIWTGNVDVGYDGEVSVVAPSGPVTVVGAAGPIGRNSLAAKSGPKSGQVTLSWNEFFTNPDGWHVVYGTKPGVYTYGVLNAVAGVPGKTKGYSFTVGALRPGQRYYFAIAPIIGGQASYVTAEVSAVAR